MRAHPTPSGLRARASSYITSLLCVFPWCVCAFSSFLTVFVRWWFVRPPPPSPHAAFPHSLVEDMVRRRPEESVREGGGPVLPSTQRSQSKFGMTVFLAATFDGALPLREVKHRGKVGTAGTSSTKNGKRVQVSSSARRWLHGVLCGCVSMSVRFPSA